jgi:mannose-6-phosphate isomerase-like protein (cupin superfamily)
MTLRAGKQTRGHRHDDTDEIYRFSHVGGMRVILLDNKTLFVKKDSIVYIPKGVSHRVINPTSDDMVFETISPGRIARPTIPRGDFSQSLQKLQSP